MKTLSARYLLLGKLYLRVVLYGTITLTGGVACDNDDAVFLMGSCPPSRRFESMGNTSILGSLTATGDAQDWYCGRNTGLRLGKNTRRVISANLTASSAREHLAIVLRFQPGNTSTQRLQTILSMTNLARNENDVDGCRGDLLQIGQYGRHLLLRYRDASMDCRVLLLRRTVLSSYSIIKLLFTTNQTDSLVIVDGALINRSAGLDFSGLGQPRRVLLFGSRDNDVDYFDGALHLFALSSKSSLEMEPTTWNMSGWGENCTFPVFDIADGVEPDPLVIPQGSNESHVLSFPISSSFVVEIQLVLLPEKGFLLLEGDKVKVGTNFSFPNTLAYTLTDDLFFDSPNINALGIESGFPSESFSYRLRSFDDDGFLVAQSRAIHFPIRVQLANHRPEIKPPDRVVPSGATWTISGLELLDSLDHDMNLVRVDVVSLHGRVTVPTEKGRKRLRRYECSGRSSSPWQCTGDGYQDRRLIFVAAPSEVTLILHDLEYQNLSPVRPEADNVTVTVYDGKEGDCLTETEHLHYQEALGNSYPSLHPYGCVSVQVVIPIPGFSVESTGVNVFDEGNQADSILPDMLFWVLFSATLVFFCGSRFRKCALRGSAVDADDDGEDAFPRGLSRSGVFPAEVFGASSVNWDETTMT